MDTIKKELSAKVMELAPKTLNRNAQVSRKDTDQMIYAWLVPVA